MYTLTAWATAGFLSHPTSNKKMYFSKCTHFAAAFLNATSVFHTSTCWKTNRQTHLPG